MSDLAAFYIEGMQFGVFKGASEITASSLRSLAVDNAAEFLIALLDHGMALGWTAVTPRPDPKSVDIIVNWQEAGVVVNDRESTGPDDWRPLVP